MELRNFRDASMGICRRDIFNQNTSSLESEFKRGSLEVTIGQVLVDQAIIDVIFDQTIYGGWKGTYWLLYLVRIYSARGSRKKIWKIWVHSKLKISMPSLLKSMSRLAWQQNLNNCVAIRDFCQGNSNFNLVGRIMKPKACSDSLNSQSIRNPVRSGHIRLTSGETSDQNLISRNF